MAQTFRILGVFLSSPSGLEAERKAVRDVIAQVNADLGTTFRLHFNVVGSDTHAVPGVSSDPQAVINQQALDMSDVYLGIMWHRYGTATPRAGSGTQEEFDRALGRSPQPHILFYFKTAPVPLLGLDPEQLKGVYAFRARMQGLGALYSDFASIAEFKIQLRTHFTSLMARLGTKSQPDAPPATPRTSGKHTDSPDLGLLDYLDATWTHIPAFRKSCGGVLTVLNRLVLDYREMRIDLANSPVNYGSADDRARARLVYDRAGTRITKHVAEMNAEIPRFRQTIREGVDAMTRALVVGTEDSVAGAEGQLPLARALYQLLSSSLSPGRAAFSQVRSHILNAPRMTRSLNEAQKELTLCLTDLSDAFDEAQRILQEAIASIDRITE